MASNVQLPTVRTANASERRADESQLLAAVGACLPTPDDTPPYSAGSGMIAPEEPTRRRRAACFARGSDACGMGALPTSLDEKSPARVSPAGLGSVQRD